MIDLKDYVKDRNEAMLDYPDTTKLEALVRKYPKAFSPRFIVLWATATQDTKVRTLEIMIDGWTDAPSWLCDKVKAAIIERRCGRHEN